jgi:predicted enzyme related to lactoylglutathione lyase
VILRIRCETLKRGIIAVTSVAALGACSSTPPPARPVVHSITDDPAPEVLEGKVVWRDLLTHDAAAARSFYEGQFIGGLFAVDRDEVDSPLWLLSVSVADVDVSVAQARDLGAAITVPPSDLPNRGRYAVVADPQGAFLVLLRATSGDPRDGRVVEPGDWLWTELWTTDAPAAVRFYENLLDYTSEGIAARVRDVPADEYREAAAEGDLPIVFFAMFGGEEPRAGIHQLPGDAAPHWLPYVAVRDAAAATQRALELGAEVLLPPDAVANHEAAILVDPTGAAFGVQQWPRPEGGDR